MIRQSGDHADVRSADPTGKVGERAAAAHDAAGGKEEP
jgi:hypothetical protein